MPGTATATTEVERLIEHRLEQIERELRPFAELEAERRRLQEALGVLRSGDLDAVRSTSPSPRRKGRARRTTRGERAPRGSNLTAILEHVSARPGSTAGDIAAATGISRGVVYSATSRLSSAGKLERQQKPDGQVGYRISG